MIEKTPAILVPGIGPLPWVYDILTKTFRLRGIKMEFFPVEWWSDGKNKFIETQNKFFDRIDKLYNGRDRVSLLGISAGGPFTLEALTSLEGMVRKVVTVAGCNSPKNETNKVAYEKLYEGNKVFEEMIESLDGTMETLKNRNDLAKNVMTYVVKGDDVVPNESQFFDGADFIEIPTIKLPHLTHHESSIVRGMVFDSRNMAKFLRNENN